MIQAASPRKKTPKTDKKERSRQGEIRNEQDTERREDHGG